MYSILLPENEVGLSLNSPSNPLTPFRVYTGSRGTAVLLIISTIFTGGGGSHSNNLVSFPDPFCARARNLKLGGGERPGKGSGKSSTGNGRNAGAVRMECS